MQADYLEVRGLTVSFDGFKAVDGVDLTVLQSDLRFLIGPNGAGKTTIIDALTGLVSATGSAHYGKAELIGRKSDQIARLGVSESISSKEFYNVVRQSRIRLKATAANRLFRVHKAKESDRTFD